MSPNLHKLKLQLDAKVAVYNQSGFIEKDPVSIPHAFTLRQDREIAGLIAATLSWGNRTSIINSCKKILQWMDYAPYQFITSHQETDLRRFLHFAHRTFNATDLLYFIDFLSRHYLSSNSLETAFTGGVPAVSVREALSRFHNHFFEGEHPERTRKHVATPDRNSACKRLNMFLRWMVRKDDAGVDFGLWQSISMSQLICPLDVHVARVASRLELIPDMKANWNNATTLTEALRAMNPTDPVVYDYALFGMGCEEGF